MPRYNRDPTRLLANKSRVHANACLLHQIPICYRRPMNHALIISSNAAEVRVALLESGKPLEVHRERRSELGVFGTIYKAKVTRVLPGMQAAFVDIGLERNAFLYVNDAVLTSPSGPSENIPENIVQDIQENIEHSVEKPETPTHRSMQPIANIRDVVKQGETLLVQIHKEPISTKGARITKHIAIPGRYLVYMPLTPHIGVSQKITDGAERERLRTIISAVCTGTSGFILRTVAENTDASEIEREAHVLIKTWEHILAEVPTQIAPACVYADVNLTVRAVRDMWRDNVARIVIDNRADFERVRTFIQAFAPEKMSCLEYYDEEVPLFESLGIEDVLQKALDPRVLLKSGGSIVIEKTEALTVVDVNSGRFVGKNNLNDTVLRTNLEAAHEVAIQLRLRNIGGIIVVDFIDMFDPLHRTQVMQSLREALAHDRVKTTVIGMSELGLVQMTRKRLRESLPESLQSPCTVCKGTGRVKSIDTMALEVLRAITKHLKNQRPPQEPSSTERPTLHVHTSPDVAHALMENYADMIACLEATYHTTLAMLESATLQREEYTLKDT